MLPEPVARRLDDLAHLLYAPTGLGRRVNRALWHHRIHLIPARLLKAACGAYDRSLGVTKTEMTRMSPLLNRLLQCPDGHMTAYAAGGTCTCGASLTPAGQATGDFGHAR